MLTQVPLHRSNPAGHLHEPFEQLVPPLQTMPQEPQLLSSEFVFTQEPPQLVEPEHIATHPPALQDSPAAQTFPHVPQSRGSLLMSTHCPPQAVWPGPQLHAPALQV